MDSLRCGFCFKHHDEVRLLIAGPRVHICNECTDAMYAIAHPAALATDVVQVAARAIYGETWVAKETGPDSPTWDDITDYPVGERYRSMARSAIIAIDAYRAKEDEEIARQIAEDPDTPPDITDEDLDQAEIWHGDRFIGRVRGGPEGSEKELVTLRLDQKILAHFRAGGPAWQTRLNDALLAVADDESFKRSIREALKPLAARPEGS